MLTCSKSNKMATLGKPRRRMDCRVKPGNDAVSHCLTSEHRHCEERTRRSNPDSRASHCIASSMLPAGSPLRVSPLRSQWRASGTVLATIGERRKRLAPGFRFAHPGYLLRGANND
jgi:hypothetical protein